MKILSVNAVRALLILQSNGAMRGSDLGWELWGDTTAVPDRGTGSQHHNKFCRAAGKVLRELERAGMVCSVSKETCTVWKVINGENVDSYCSKKCAE